MAKSEETLRLEREIWIATRKAGVFGCFEVTIGFGGDERVDYMTIDTKGVVRCYEIKASKRDFYSDAKKSFVGHYNYFVMPREVYEQVKHDVPDHVGVYCGKACVKRSKRKDLSVSIEVLRDSLIRSMHRDYEKYLRMSTDSLAIKYKREAELARKERDLYLSINAELRKKLWLMQRGYKDAADHPRK